MVESAIIFMIALFLHYFREDFDGVGFVDVLIWIFAHCIAPFSVAD